MVMTKAFYQNYGMCCFLIQAKGHGYTSNTCIALSESMRSLRSVLIALLSKVFDCYYALWI